MRDRVVGSILGGALGDGWGRPFEGGARREHVTLPDELLVSDDTQLTLATCEAVIERGRVDPEAIAARFVAWFRTGRLSGLGASTLKALRDLDAGAHWALAGAKGERSAGNGAAMRVAPLAFLVDPADERQRQTLRDVCRITHHHEEAYVGALAVTIATRLAATPGYPLAHLQVDVADRLPDSQVRDRIVQLDASADGATPSQLAESWGNSGFVVDSVPLAIFAARDISRHPFADVLQRAIEAGGDTDTIASMTGQIAGAAVGAPALPDNLLSRLRNRHQMAQTAERFASIVGGVAMSRGFPP